MFDTPRVKLTANAGLGWVNENFIVAPDDDYTALRESVALDIFAVPDRVQLFHKHDGYFGVTGDDNLFVRTQNGVRLGVVANFVTTAQLDLDYDRLAGAGTASRAIALRRSTFGYRFWSPVLIGDSYRCGPHCYPRASRSTCAASSGDVGFR